MDLKSKKMWAAVASVLLTLAIGIFGTGRIPHEEFTTVVVSIASIVCFYLTGQGLSDFGKEKARIESKETEAPK